jgi:hypothetical protein
MHIYTSQRVSSWLFCPSLTAQYSLTPWAAPTVLAFFIPHDDTTMYRLYGGRGQAEERAGVQKHRHDWRKFGQ